MDLIDAFVDENPFGFDGRDLEVVRSWKDLVAGKFFAFRQLKKYMVFLTSEGPTLAYGVLALSEPIGEIIGPPLPVMCETTLLPFEGAIVYDGLINAYNIYFGGGIKRSLDESYREAKRDFGIITSLPRRGEAPGPRAKRRDVKGGKPRAKSRRRTSLVGRWRITWMEMWGQGFVDEEVEGFIRFDGDGRGEFHFGYVHCGIDHRPATRGGKPAVEFSFEGHDEMEPCSGRGWAALDGDRVEGEIHFFRGDSSGFRATKAR